MTGYKRKLATALVCGAAAMWPACSSPPPRQQQEKAGRRTAPVKILQFYSSMAAVPRGQSLLLCYGVESAASARIEPAVGQVSPSPNRCVEVSPRRDTTYALTAVGADGSTAAADVAVRVLPPRAPKPEQARAAESMIHMFVATDTELNAGQAVTICYDVRGADAVSLEPGNQPSSSGKRCVVVRPERTTAYKLTARGGGNTETRELTVRVR